MRHVTGPSEISDLVRTGSVVIALFGRSNCTECDYVYGRLERFMARRSEFAVRYVDLDAHPTLAGMHVVHDVPTTVVHVGGSQISKQVGGIDLPKLRRDIERFQKVWEKMQQDAQTDDGHGSQS